MRESRVERALKRGVEAAGGECHKMVWPGHRHAPDRLVLWPGESRALWASNAAQVHFIELKAPGKKARAGQQREHLRLRQMGFKVLVISTKEEVRTYVRTYGHH